MPLFMQWDIIIIVASPSRMCVYVLYLFMDIRI